MPFGRRRDGALDQLVLWTGKAHIDDLGAVSDGVIQCLQDHIGIAFCSPRCRAERADRQNPRRRRTSHQPCMRRDGARDAGAEDVRTFLGSKRVEGVGDGVRKFRVFDVDAGIDHRNRELVPWASVCACGSRSFASAYCAGSPSSGAVVWSCNK